MNPSNDPAVPSRSDVALCTCGSALDPNGRLGAPIIAADGSRHCNLCLAARLPILPLPAKADGQWMITLAVQDGAHLYFCGTNKHALFSTGLSDATPFIGSMVDEMARLLRAQFPQYQHMIRVRPIP